VISAVALISLLGLINTVVMAAPRILFGLSRDQLMPAALSGVNPGGTPTAALVLTSGCAAVLVLAGSFDHLLGMGAFLYVVLPLTGIAAQVQLRIKEPNRPRPFLSWGYPLTPWIVGACSLGFLIGALVRDTGDSLLALALVGLGGIIGELWRRRQPQETSNP
jgi:APA family basic amino acid/polyamine antiporter